MDLRTRAWIVGALALAVLPHVTRLPVWVTVFFFAVAVALIVPVRRARRTAPGWLVALAVGAGAAGILFQFGTLVGHSAGLALLVLMLAVKLLELRSLRDMMVVICMAYFVVLTHFLFVESIAIAAAMVAVVIVITTALIRATHPSPNRRAAQDLRLAAVLIGQAAPLTLAAFIFFPRVAGTLWQLPEETRTGVTGLSDSMSPGAISRIAQSQQVAFRVVFHDPIPPPQKRYWRGPVFWYTDGLTWTGGKEWHQRMLNLRPSPAQPDIRYEGGRVRHTITLEPHRERWLLALDLALEIPGHAYAATDVQWVSFAPVTERVRYDAVSVTDFTIKPSSIRELRRCLQLPKRVSPRAAALARGWRAEAEEDADVVRFALDFFRASDLRYTLVPPAIGHDFLDEFLFETRAGFCEHFAAAFALLMRLAGLPARVVTGYMGGETNPLGDYMIVRQSHAHAWCEVWLREKGWTRVDPTVESSPRRLAESEGAVPGGLDGVLRLSLWDNRFFRHVRYVADALNNAWNQWVLGYDPALQMRLLARAGLRHPTWRTLVAALFISVSVVVAALALWMLARAARAADPVLAAYQRFCDRMAAVGLARHPFEGPRDFARRIVGARPDLAPAAQSITDLYVELRYARPAAGHMPADLVARVRQFRAG
ncbi:MAG: DUF3488 domain-containing protein [Kiritimatiellae bacterium]|nr:DUF3488 domain-containing protein [Kiritimatiellia bacterium]